MSSHLRTPCADSARLEKRALSLDPVTLMLRGREVGPRSPRRQVVLPEQEPGCTEVLKHHDESGIWADP